MKINALELNNFSSFEGINKFNFEIKEQGKNIVLIGGQNGAGKTSIFSAIKVALYGPLAFGYVGANSHYTQRIKEFINTRAFQMESIESGVSLSITLLQERELVDYEINRMWSYEKQRLVEKLVIKKSGKELSEEEVRYFQNYLQTVVPPEIFEFFLFDGEEVGNIFSTPNYSSYVKKALFTMCELDVFETIRKHTSGYTGKVKSDSSDEESEYKHLLEELEKKEESFSIKKETIEDLTDKLSKIEVRIEDFQTAFKNAGGISQDEKKKLLLEQQKAEALKSEMTVKIKDFFENQMPFIITKNIAKNVSSQVELEEKIAQYQHVKEVLSEACIRDILKKNKVSMPLDTEAILEDIYEKFMPDNQADCKIIHDLSRVQKNKILGLTSSLENFSSKELVDIIDKRRKASRVTADINKTIKNSMGEDQLSSFMEEENRLIREKMNLKESLSEAISDSEKLESHISDLRSRKDQLYELILSNAKDRNIYELSGKVSTAMEKILSKKTDYLIRNIEKLTVENLNSIFRKSNLITHIEIGEDFKFNLYQDQVYSQKKLAILIKNLGLNEFVKVIGNKGIQKLLKTCQVDKVDDLKDRLETDAQEIDIKLFKKVKLSRLSKGERQIFILSLYWAIIRLSNRDIPFVIDTPYARIDAKHRREISEKFFSKISDQVIILSTDEEINKDYYKIIKPFVAREYLLTNNESENKTTIQNKYFYEV